MHAERGHSPEDGRMERYDEAKQKLRGFFAVKDPEEIERLRREVRAYASLGGLDAEAVVREIDMTLQEENVDTAVERAFSVLKPLVDAKFDTPELFARLRRERVFEARGNVQVSELLYYDVDLVAGTAHLHVGEKNDLPIADVVTALRGGMREFARHVREDDRIRTVQVASWIVAKYPGLLEKAGFTLEGLVEHPTDEARSYAGDRPIAQARMSRETLLARYAN